MIRPAASPGGFLNTLPALSVPPGWCSLLQRVISRNRPSTVRIGSCSVAKQAEVTTSQV